jgi:anhydro-N-acetylmuramic acid kinase
MSISHSPPTYQTASESMPGLRLPSRDATMRVLGLMSGTSADGIDGALVEFAPDRSWRLLWLESWPYVPPVRERLQALMERADTAAVTRAGWYVAELHAAAVQAFLARRPDAAIDLLAVHGQTIGHFPEPEMWDGISVRGSCQVLAPSVLAAKTGFPVAADFRTRDLAEGGEGAPLVPMGDLRFFGGRLASPIAVVNIGGIANLTVLAGSPASAVAMAFDTGPGNMLLDALAFRASQGQQAFDHDGRLAAAGTMCPETLAVLLDDAFFRRPPPKSTGREQFGRFFLDRLIETQPALAARPADLMATLVQFTVESLIGAVERFVLPSQPITHLILAGGGACNPVLVERLRQRMGSAAIVERSESWGVPAMGREAMAFAALGEALLRGWPGNVPVATGARRPAVLGSLTPA